MEEILRKLAIFLREVAKTCNFSRKVIDNPESVANILKKLPVLIRNFIYVSYLLHWPLLLPSFRN